MIQVTYVYATVYKIRVDKTVDLVKGFVSATLLGKGVFYIRFH